ncbi:MAG: metal-dependent transcriptional regulator [Planctomycetota bacterium]|nr:MAG: metal-dependent transcriptional regulator [Planctomycetota bacterium]
MYTESVENYLKAIYKLSSRQGGGYASTKAIAEVLEVRSASVSKMLQRLEKMGMVHHRSYQGVQLTSQGRRIALRTIRRHRLLETYLYEVLGYSWEQLHSEAELLEHYISDLFEAKIDEALGFPTHDPHGDPIPSKEGKMPDIQHIALANVEVPGEVVIARVPDSSAQFLCYLKEVGLLPKVSLKVLRKEPFNGPLLVVLGDREQVIGREVAGKIWVKKKRDLIDGGRIDEENS